MDQATILVVEDSPTEQRALTVLLEKEGYDVLTASDGEEAIAKASGGRPRLVLLDVVLPRKNGFQVCRQLKTSPETRHLKVILVTSKTQESDRFWGLKQGADDYLTKPFDPRALLSAVAKQL